MRFLRFMCMAVMATGLVLAATPAEGGQIWSDDFDSGTTWNKDSGSGNPYDGGDFAGFNLCFEESAGRLVILDWSSAPLLGRNITYGSRFFDIIWLVIFIFYGAPRQCLFNWDDRAMADAFLAGYAEHNPEIIQRLSGDFKPLMRRYYRKTVWYLAKQRSCYKAARYLLYQSFIYPRFARYNPGRG